mgnify:CR=1 FL=1
MKSIAGRTPATIQAPEDYKLRYVFAAALYFTCVAPRVIAFACMVW